MPFYQARVAVSRPMNGSTATVGAGAHYGRERVGAKRSIDSWVFALDFRVPLQTRLQELVDEDRRGKLFGAQNTLLNIATTLPLAGAGALAERFGVLEVIAAVGLAMLVAAVATWKGRELVG